MGSSGTGRLSDYSDATRNPEGGGGASGQDKCQESITATLEDVARNQYFSEHNDVPAKGTPVQLIHKERLTVQTFSGEDLGYLPTKYNYIAGCLQKGNIYAGSVQASGNSAIPSVIVFLSNVTP